MRLRRIHTLALVIAVVLAPRLARADEVLSFGAGGLRLGEQVLHAGAVGAAAYDPAQDLVWFRTGSTLRVIDLRDPKRAAVKIVEKLPADGAFAITGASTAGFWTGYGEWVVSYPVLRTGKTTKLTSKQEGDFGDNSDDDDARARKIKKAKIVGKKWLKGLSKRKARATPAMAANAPTDRVEIAESDWCEDPEQCGAATTLGASKYRIVVTAISYGAGYMESGCQLYDPDTKRFASSNESGTWVATSELTPSPCTDLGLSSDGVRYFVGNNLCSVERSGVTCATADDRVYFGWTDL